MWSRSFPIYAVLLAQAVFTVLALPLRRDLIPLALSKRSNVAISGSPPRRLSSRDAVQALLEVTQIYTRTPVDDPPAESSSPIKSTKARKNDSQRQKLKTQKTRADLGIEGAQADLDAKRRKGRDSTARWRENIKRKNAESEAHAAAQPAARVAAQPTAQTSAQASSGAQAAAQAEKLRPGPPLNTSFYFGRPLVEPQPPSGTVSTSGDAEGSTQQSNNAAGGSSRTQGPTASSSNVAAGSTSGNTGNGGGSAQRVKNLNASSSESNSAADSAKKLLDKASGRNLLHPHDT